MAIHADPLGPAQARLLCSACGSEFDRGPGENQTLCPMRHVGACGRVGLLAVAQASRRPTRCLPPAASTVAFSPGLQRCWRQRTR